VQHHRVKTDSQQSSTNPSVKNKFMLYYDHYYTIGKTHITCEDFALQGNQPTPYIVLSDGCSSSKNTDIGARILALTTRHILEHTPEWPLDYSNFGRYLITKAWTVAEKMQLDSSSALDATVMLAFLHLDNIHIYVYGDGCLFFKDYAGKISYIEIAFTHNAPYYLTYWHDEPRWHEYAKYEAKPLFLRDTAHGLTSPMPFQTPLSFSFPLNQFEIIAIASDGATQCIDTKQQTKIPLAQVAANLLTFNNLEGEFVKSHTQQLVAEYAKQGIFPADDLSIGVFVSSG
jgi:hypothetical protein